MRLLGIASIAHFYEADDVAGFGIPDPDPGLPALQRFELVGFGEGVVAEDEQVGHAPVVRELETAFLDDGHDAVHGLHGRVSGRRQLRCTLSPGTPARSVIRADLRIRERSPRALPGIARS